MGNDVAKQVLVLVLQRRFWSTKKCGLAFDLGLAHPAVEDAVLVLTLVSQSAFSRPIMLITRENRLQQMHVFDIALTLCALAERIPNETRLTAAHRTVVENPTSRIVPAGPGARVYAFLANASLVCLTIGVGYTFGSTIGRHPDAAQFARTHRSLIYHPTDAVGSAGRGIAGICRNCYGQDS